MTKTDCKCLFCGQDCIKEYSQLGGEYFYNCINNCGKYFTEEGLERKIKHFSQEDKERISIHLKNRAKNDFQRVYTNKILAEIIKNNSQILKGAQ